MTNLNLKDFFESGAFLQTGPDLFEVLLGPFTPKKLADIGEVGANTLFYRPNFWDFLNTIENSAQNLVYLCDKSYVINREDFIGLLAGFKAAEPSLDWSEPSEDDFSAQFFWSQNRIAEGQLTKTVPIIRQRAAARFGLENKVWCLRKLLQQKDYGWSYAYFDRNDGIIGHSPEMLVEWNSKNKNLKTMALAGTYVKSSDAGVEILKDAKVLNEHQIVVNDISNKLTGMTYSRGATHVLELRYLLHLRTEFSVSVNEASEAFKIITRLHPTSAMGIFPADLQKLSEFSRFGLQQKRGAFAAPFAFIHPAGIDCIVAIRNLQFTENEIEIFSGCGITSQSDFGLELQELVHKRNSVKRMLGLRVE